MSVDGPKVASSDGAAAAARHKGYLMGPELSRSLLTFASSRWKLWSEETASVLVSHSDRDERYTVACWGQLPGSDAEGEKPKFFMALGCASGRVQVWAPASAELLGPVAAAFAALARGADCAVSALCAAPQSRASVFAGCRALPEVLELGLHDGTTRASFKAGKVGVAQLSANSFGSNEILVSMGSGASTTLRVWGLDGLSSATAPPLVARLAGPANAARSVDVCAVAAGQTLVLCCDGTMQVDIFAPPQPSADTAATGKETGRKDTSPPLQLALALSCHEQVHWARFGQEIQQQHSKRSSAGGVRIVGVGPSLAAIWALRLPLSGKVHALPPLFHVGAVQLGGSILSARFFKDSGLKSSSSFSQSLLVAFGPGSQPSFASARAPAAGTEAVVQLLHTEASTAAPPASAATKDGKAKESVEPVVLGPLQAAMVRQRGTKRPIAEDADRTTRAKLDLLPEVGKGGQALGLSLAPLVRQGLRAKDTKSIDMVVGKVDKRIVQTTLMELSGAEAFELLQECTRRLIKVPSTAHEICIWVQAILCRFCAFIGSRPSLRTALEPLHDALKARVMLDRPLVRLRGRLQVLRDMSKQAAALQDDQTAEKPAMRTPLLDYTEGDEDASDDDADRESKPEGADTGGSSSAPDMDEFFDEGDDSSEEK